MQAKCPACGFELHAMYHLALLAPYPMEKLTKRTLRDKDVSIVSTDWDLVAPMCIACGWREQRAPKTERDVILTLMRELILRGADASDIEKMLRQSGISAIDILAASMPKLAQD